MNWLKVELHCLWMILTLRILKEDHRHTVLNYRSHNEKWRDDYCTCGYMRQQRDLDAEAFIRRGFE